jgi:hypothetical protein
MRTFLLCPIIALVAGCTTAPAPVMPERLAKVYADLLIAAESRGTSAAADSVLAAHTMSRQELEAALADLHEDVKKWRPLLETSVTLLENRVRRTTAP